MAAGPRFQIVTELSSFEGWRNCLAVDRRDAPARPVVLSFVPARVADDPSRLARLSEDVERAGRLFHPSILRVVGMETFSGSPVVVQEWRDGESLRELLDTGTRMPPEVAARIAAEACDAVAHAHGRAAEAGRPFAHGALRAERILVAADGSVLVSGFGRASEGIGAPPAPAADLKALGALLLQCLAGEEPRKEGLPGVPDRLAEVAARAAEGGGAYGDAAALRDALRSSLPLAPAEAVRAWADKVLPPESGTRGRRRRSLEAALAAAAAPADAERPPAATPAPPAPRAPARPAPAPLEVSDDAIVSSPTPVPGPTPVSDDLIVGEATAPGIAKPPTERTPEIAFPRPAPPPVVDARLVATAAAAALVVGLLIGIVLGR